MVVVTGTPHQGFGGPGGVLGFGEDGGHPRGPGHLPGRAGQPPDDRRADAYGAGHGQAEQPALLQVLARADAVRERDRPAQVGEQVDGAPQDAVDAAAEQAGDDHRQHQVEGDRA